MVYPQPSVCPREWDTQTPMGFLRTNGSPNLGQTTRPNNNQQLKKKRTCKIIIIIIGLITAIRNDTDNTMDNRMTITRKQKWEGKQLYERFKRLINISHDKTWTWLRKGTLKRETESLLIAAQDHAVRTNHIKAGIDKTLQNSKCRLCGDRDETINHIITEYSKLAQKEYKTRHDWVGNEIHWEMCKKFKIWPYKQMVYAQPSSCPRDWHT